MYYSLLLKFPDAIYAFRFTKSICSSSHCIEMRKHQCLIIVIIVAIINYAIILSFIDNQKEITNIQSSFHNVKNFNESSNPSTCTPVQNQINSNVIFYKPSQNRLRYYEYRYDLNERNFSSNESSLILLFTGTNRKCIDWWDFLEGAIIISQMRSFGFSILTICSSSKTYNISMPIQTNMDAREIFATLQVWMNDVYLSHFQRYPRLYLFGLSRGAQMCSLLCRVLPVKAQILYIAPGYSSSLLIPSDLDKAIYSRLINDDTFANWFFFEHCSKLNFKTNSTCPFHHLDRNYFSPIPPTYFVHHRHDHIYHLSQYQDIVSALQRNAINLGGIILSDIDAIKLHIAEPINLTRTNIQNVFDKWICKPWFSQFFYQHATNSSEKGRHPVRNTCWCCSIDFLRFKMIYSLLKTWSKTDRDNYLDYIHYIEKSEVSFCETVCGKIMTEHAMASHHIVSTLTWLQHMDFRRKVYRR